MLPKEDLEKIKKTIEEAEKRIPALEKDIEDAKRAGLDVSAEIEELNKLKESVRKMKLVYG
jgi:predicted  nucleic acid-binding Zn-ribbon protein